MQRILKAYMPGLPGGKAGHISELVLPQWTSRLEIMCVYHSHVAKPMLRPLPKCSTGLFLECWTLRDTADRVSSVLRRWRCSSVWGWRCVCVMAGGPAGCTSAFWPPEVGGQMASSYTVASVQLSLSTAPAYVLFLVLYLNALAVPGLYTPFSQWYFLHLTLLIVLSWTLILPSKPTSNITSCKLLSGNLR